MLSELIGTAADTLLPTINAMDDLAIEKQIRTLSNTRDSLSGVRGEIRGEAQTTYALMLPLVDRLAAINAVSKLDAMKRSTGEVMESAAKLASPSP